MFLGCSHAWEDYDPRVTSTGGATSSSSSSSGGASKCGGTSVLVSDFDKNDLEVFWDVNDWGGAGMSETGGELVAKLPVNSTDGSGVYAISKYYYNFRDDFVSVEVARAAEPTSAAWTAFSVGPNENNYIEIYQEGMTLNFGVQFEGNYNKYWTVPYDATEHRFWQIRESAGRVYYETSPDGEKWIAQTDVPVPPSLLLEYSRMVMASGCDSNQANPGEAHFDRLNRGGAPMQNYCPMSSMRDDFEDGMRSGQWMRSFEGQTGMLAEEGGQFVIHYVPNQEAHAGLVSAYAYDLRGSSIVLEVPQVPAAEATAYVGIELNGPGGNNVEMFVSEGNLKLAVEIDGNLQELSIIPYSAQQHRWWKIREAENILYWETSPDGKTWKQELQMSPPPVPVSILDIEIHGGTWAGFPDPGESRADNLNLSTP